MALAGNKADLLEVRQVPAEVCYFTLHLAGASRRSKGIYAQENGLFFMETSAKMAIDLNDVFHEIARKLIQGQQVQNPQGGMVLNQRPSERMVSSSSCCA